MLQQVKRTIRDHGMLAPGDAVVVAVSGGVDSMVLLHVLADIRPSLSLTLHAAHLDHGLRGDEGGRDAAAVAAWGARLDVPVTCGRAGPLDRRGGSLQRAARAARYAFLGGVADRLGAGRIAVGHTRDDVAETLLLNLLRGSGLRGLAGIPPVRGRIVRPLVETARESVLAYARAHEIPWVEDPSNRTVAYRRNRIRAELLPALAKEHNPRILETLARTAAIVRAEDAFLERVARDALARLGQAGRAGTAALRGDGLATLDPVVRRRVLRAAAARLPGRPLLSARHLLALDGWAAPGPRRGRCGFLRGVDAWWEGKDLVLAPAGVPPARPAGAVPLQVGVPTRVSPFGMTFLAEAIERDGGEAPPPPEPGVAWIDAAAAAGLAVRSWRPGDRFRPLGLGGSKKLQDFFVDAKVPRTVRAQVPLVVAREYILWVVGYRIDDRAKITPATRRALRLTASPDAPPGA